MRNIVILGATGSIGDSACWVVRQLADRLRVLGLAAGDRWEKLASLAREFGVRHAAIRDPGCLEDLRGALPDACRTTCDPAALEEMVTADDVDMVLCAISGTGGLRPVLAAIRAGKDIALASKEVLVMAGQIVTQEVDRYGVRMIPVDSEHSAIFQCMEGRDPATVRRLVLTASGGPFRETSVDDFPGITPAMALRHPTWNMGPKITIDSATLMNKALEVIEAKWLFRVEADRIDVVVHPQSVIHSMVEFIDSGLLAQLGRPDMRLPIQYAFLYPERVDTGLPRHAFGDTPFLSFEPPDHERFPAIRLAKEALAAGGTMPAVLNAANEAAVEAFRCGRLSFPGIWQGVATVMRRHQVCDAGDLEAVLAADQWARDELEALIDEDLPGNEHHVLQR